MAAIPLGVLTAQKSKKLGEPQTHTEDYRHSDEEFGDTQFTLSAFGLPEPVGIRWAKPTPRYVRFLLAAAECAGLAIVFRFLDKRQRAAGTPG